MRYAMAEKKKLAILLCVEKVIITAYPIFVGYGYQQYGGCGKQGSHYLLY